MPRVKRAVHSQKKRRKVFKTAKGFRGGHGNLLRSAKEAIARALRYAYRDRRTKKREFRALWITRVNAAARENGLSYSQLMFASKRPASRSTARSWRTSPSTTPPASGPRRKSQGRAGLKRRHRGERWQAPPTRSGGFGRKGSRPLPRPRNESDLLEAKGRFFGKKGAISEILKGIGSLSVEERKVVGSEANRARTELETVFDERLASIREQERAAREGMDRLDVTLPGRGSVPGHRHPIAQTMADIISVFRRLGFSVQGGPDVEKDYYNFEALNFPPEHPARDMQDTFYVESEAGSWFFAPILPRSRSGRWNGCARRSASSLPAPSTGPTPTSPTLRCSTRSKGSPWTGTSPWPT